MLCPPMIIDAAQIEEILNRFAKALDDTHKWAQSEGKLAA
jgi:adenosylmethionine-8-amino-7-oxononanoate aminotransferase